MENARWKEFEMRVEAFRFYLNVALQTNVFFYAIAGAILGFYLNRTTNTAAPVNPIPGTPIDPNTATNNEYLVFVLLLPILIATVLGGIFNYAARLQKHAAAIIEEIREELRNDGLAEMRLRIKVIPDISLLHIILRSFGWIFYLDAVALIGVPILKEYVAHNGYPLNLVIFVGLGGFIFGGVVDFMRYYTGKDVEKIEKDREEENIFMQVKMLKKSKEDGSAHKVARYPNIGPSNAAGRLFRRLLDCMGKAKEDRTDENLEEVEMKAENTGERK
ncbi:MAG: hypothetical protein WCD76_14185 [Pyrinomonadaceae bacterium]